MANGRKFKRICTICHKEYEYCPTCSKYSHLPRWMDAYCSENCKDLYNITAGWINGWLDKDVEIARLSKMDLTNKKQFPKWMQDVIGEMENYKPEIPAETIEKVINIEKENTKKVEEKEENKVIPHKKNSFVPKKEKVKNEK